MPRRKLTEEEKAERNAKMAAKKAEKESAEGQTPEEAATDSTVTPEGMTPPLESKKDTKEIELKVIVGTIATLQDGKTVYYSLGDTFKLPSWEARPLITDGFVEKV